MSFRYEYRSVKLRVLADRGESSELALLADRCTAAYNELNYLRRRAFFHNELPMLSYSKSDPTFKYVYDDYGPDLGTQTVTAIGQKTLKLGDPTCPGWPSADVHVSRPGTGRIHEAASSTIRGVTTASSNSLDSVMSSTISPA